MKDYYCGIADKPQDARPATSSTGSPASSASRATPTAPATPSTSRSARATPSSRRSSSPGRTPRSPTAARSTSPGSARRSSAPTATVLRRIQPKVAGDVDVPDARASTTSTARSRASPVRARMAWRMGGFPLDQVHDPRQDRLGRGLRQAVDVVGRVLHRRLRRGDDGQPGRHRLRHLGPGDPQDLGGALRHRRRWTSTRDQAAIPGVVAAARPAAFAATARSCRRARRRTDEPPPHRRPGPHARRPHCARPGSTGC